MSGDYSYFRRLRGETTRRSPRSSRRADIGPRPWKLKSPDELPAHDGVPVLAAVGPAAEF